jgi:hypothetical protein
MAGSSGVAALTGAQLEITLPTVLRRPSYRARRPTMTVDSGSGR